MGKVVGRAEFPWFGPLNMIGMSHGNLAQFTRSLSFGHLILLNHGYLLLAVNSMYDEALHHTNEEMMAKGKGNIDVQSVVKKPEGVVMEGVVFLKLII